MGFMDLFSDIFENGGTSKQSEALKSEVWKVENKNISFHNDPYCEIEHMGRNFYRSSYACPYCRGVMLKTVFPPKGEYIIRTTKGAEYLKRAFTDQERLEMEEFLEFIDKGFGDWGIKLEKWLYSKAKTQQDIIYFNNMYDVLMNKSDAVYNLLCQNTNIPRDELLYDLLVPGAFLSKGPIYREWIYV